MSGVLAAETASSDLAIFVSFLSKLVTLPEFAYLFSELAMFVFLVPSPGVPFR